MSNVTVSNNIDTFMKSANAASALQSLNGVPTTGGTITGNLSVTGSLVTNTLSSISLVTNSITANEVITNITPATISSNKTFAYPADNSKIFNFNTSSGILSAIFPSSLPNGFNVGITNTGTNSVYVSSTQVNNLCATSNKNSTQFSGIYIYKTNNLLYGIGRFS